MRFHQAIVEPFPPHVWKQMARAPVSQVLVDWQLYYWLQWYRGWPGWIVHDPCQLLADLLDLQLLVALVRYYWHGHFVCKHQLKWVQTIVGKRINTCDKDVVMLQAPGRLHWLNADDRLINFGVGNVTVIIRSSTFTVDMLKFWTLFIFGSKILGAKNGKQACFWYHKRFG